MTVACKVYGELKFFNDTQEAKNYFLEGISMSEGSEQDRYVKIYEQLCSGHRYCSDEDLSEVTLRNMARMLFEE